MDYSIEALIAEGTGLKTRDEMRYTSSSESAYDGYFDAVQAELTQSFENLEFLDTYSRVNEANDAAKLRMMKRLKRVYGSTIEDPAKASSVESFIDNNIRSLEEDKKTDGSEKKPGKVKEFFGKIVEALKKMLEGLKRFFKGIWKKIKEFFTKKNEKNSRVATEEEIKKIIIGRPDVGMKDVTSNKYNKTNTNVDASGAGDWLVKFDKISKDKAKKTIDSLITIKDVAKITNEMRGTVTSNDSRQKVMNMQNQSKLIAKMNDTDIARTCFGAEKCDAKYVSKLSVKVLVNTIGNISDLEGVASKIEKVVEEGIKKVEAYYKSTTGGTYNTAVQEYSRDKDGNRVYTKGNNGSHDNDNFKSVCDMLRDAAKSSQKIVSVGVKIASVAYKCLVPKTDAQKDEYQSKVAGDKLAKMSA